MPAPSSIVTAAGIELALIRERYPAPVAQASRHLASARCSAPRYWSAFASAASIAAARSAEAMPRGSLPFGQYSSLWTCASG